MKALVVDKILRLSLHDIIRFQINLYCFDKKIRISPSQLDTLSFLGLYGDINITDFCDQIVNEEVFSNVQTVRNFIGKCVKDGYIIRSGTGNKLVSLNKEMKILCTGNILLNLKVVHVEDD